MSRAVTPPSSTAGRERACDAGGPQAWEVAVWVISYLAAAAAGGVIGNRADAGLCFFYRSLRRRWRARTGETITDSGHEDAAGARRVLDVTETLVHQVWREPAGFTRQGNRFADIVFVFETGRACPSPTSSEGSEKPLPSGSGGVTTVLIHPASLDELP